jgi:uncharacterized protein YjdB
MAPEDAIRAARTHPAMPVNRRARRRAPWRALAAACAVAASASATACDSATPPVPVATVAVVPATATVVVGSARTFTAEPRDAQGVALAGRPVTWRSINPTVATVSASGTVNAVSLGTTTIEATSEGRIGVATVTVIPVPVASVTVTVASPRLPVGGTVQAVAVPRDAAGNPLAGRVVTWATTNDAIGAVSGSGVVTGVSAGTVTITATSEGQGGSVELSVEAIAPTLTGISPVALVPGATATITGSGFSTTSAGNAVTIGGAVAPVVAASPSQLQVTVPCLRSGPAEVRVSANGSPAAITTVPMATAVRTLAPGQALVLGSLGESRCNELAPTGGAARYLVAVFSTATSPNTLTNFELAGNPPVAGGAAPVVRAPALPRLVGEGPAQPIDETLAAHDREHWRHLERDRAEYERLMARWRALPPAARIGAAVRQDTRADTLGAMRSLYYNFGGCSDTTRVMRARAIRVGTRSVIWEDSANALQSAADAELAAFYDRLGRIYDQEQHESVARTFGDPLRRDAVTDNDGVIHMVFTARLNGSGAAAYVTSCDQFPSSLAPASNFGQYFYGFVPTAAGSNLNSTANPDGWFNFMARTVVHEVKHIASMSARVANNAPQYEQSWLEEGTARHAEEVWVREAFHRVPWKGNTGWGTPATNGVYCDFHPADATCAAADPLRRPGFGMRRHFNEIRDKLLQPWNWSPYGDGSGQSGAVFYQTAWSLVRYAIDRFGASDAEFLTALTSATTTGVTNLTAVAGAPLEQLLGGWGLALFADDYPGLAAPAPESQFPTWNLRGIYAGLNASPSWQARFPTPYPIAPTQAAFGAFTSPVTGLRGGAHAYWELSGAHTAGQLLDLRGPGGVAPNGVLRLAVMRLQ